MTRIIEKTSHARQHTKMRTIRMGASKKLIVMLFFMLLAVAANVLFFRSLTNDFRDMAATVNVAAKLRLLSQKIELDLVQFIANPDQGSAAVRDGLAEFDMALSALSTGGQFFGANVRQVRTRHGTALEQVNQRWHAYRDEIDSALLMDADMISLSLTDVLSAQRYQISLSSTQLLQASEYMVDSIVRDMQKRQGLATLYMYTMFTIVLFGFLWALWFVRQRIARPLRLLYEGGERLRQGDYQVRLHHPVRDELGRLVNVFNLSTQRIAVLLDDLEYSNRSLKRAESMFRGLIKSSGIGVYVLSDGNFLFVNQEMANLFGYKAETMLSDVKAKDIFIENEPRFFSECVVCDHKDICANTEFKTCSLQRGRRQDGTVIELEIFESKMQLDDDPVTIYVALDVTQRRKDEASARLASLVYKTSSEAMVITDADSRIIHINPAFTAITGYMAQDVLGKKMNILSSGRHDPEFYKKMWSSVEKTGAWTGEIWNRRKDGEEFIERLSINTSYDENGQIQYRVGLFSDITKRKKTETIIWKQANYDSLTELPNRKMLQDELDRAITRAQVSGLSVALAFLDLDHFKDVNDTLGHYAGDTLLQQAAIRLEECLRQGDTVGRMGGDEFMIIIRDVNNMAIVDTICKRALQVLGKPFMVDGDVVKVTASLGVTLFPQDASDTSEIFKNADIAMYEAKSKGRNQYCQFTNSMQEKIATRRRLGHELTDALKYDQFVLDYQPIIDMETGRICKAEALIRWNHPLRGLLGPGEFIPFAEDSGVIDAIGHWVFKQVASQVAHWQATYSNDFQVAINFSPVQFLSDDAEHARLLDLLTEQQLEGCSIVVEITEGLLMDAGEAVKKRLRSFHERGIQVALDDFGTGYSSLSYLKKFDIDYIKIDRTFVSNLGPGSDDRALCEAIIVMAHRLGLKVVSEGIETAEQYHFLTDAGCDFGQGFLFGRPVSSDQLSELLRQRPLTVFA